jgi:predicted DCC family thiol-disulfide oxidoreductase YuxK
MNSSVSIEYPVLLIDGECSICNRFVWFLIQNDRRGQIHFASLQSEWGRRISESFNLSEKEQPPFSTALFLYKGRMYRQSDAVLRAMIQMGGWWKGMRLFLLIPPFIRNTLYHQFAIRRFQWFGQRSACTIPEPGVRQRFLE